MDDPMTGGVRQRPVFAGLELYTTILRVAATIRKLQRKVRRVFDYLRMTDNSSP